MFAAVSRLASSPIAVNFALDPFLTALYVIPAWRSCR
jgi:hypothetical protein